MNPIDWLTELGKLGKIAGDVASKGLEVAAGNVFDAIMRGIWASGLTVLRLALEGIDHYSRFTVSTTDGPIGVVWPLMLWISGVLALGLFFWQILSAVLRGGRGFTRLVVGPMQYCVALAASAGMVAALLTAADGLTTVLLQYGLNSDRFADAMHALNFLNGIAQTLSAVILGAAAIIGTFPAGFGMGFEMIIREAGINVVVATIPVLAAGLLANTTARWFWKGVRVIVALIFLKPAIALVIVIGVATMAGWQGLFGLLAGIGTLLIALFMPPVLFKLFSFIDPNAGGLRDEISDLGPDTYGPDSLPGQKLGSLFERLKNAWQDRKASDDEDGDEDDAQESANDERFDDADDEPEFEPADDDEFDDDEFDGEEADDEPDSEEHGEEEHGADDDPAANAGPDDHDVPPEPQAPPEPVDPVDGSPDEDDGDHDPGDPEAV